ncbi:MAG TPA: serine/threonine-protein kinase, partial [Polyangiaceae bacterium]|nr:serine/threonine-protein kinase [Polyangiaceae bacterium]
MPAETPAARALPSAPLDSASARAFLQERVALFARVFGTLALGFFLMGQITGARGHLVLGGRHSDLIGIIQFTAAAGFGAVWLRARRGQRSERELRWLESVASILPTLVVTSILALAPLHLRPELLGTIAIAHLLMARAVIVPSTPRRTLIVGLAIVLPFISGTYAFYVHHPSPALPPAWFFTLLAGAWCMASIGMSTLASYTIFGLRQRVREATELGQYTLEEKIGEGGMGIVYRARHAMLRRPTAIKLLPPERAGVENLARFEREVQLTSLLTHPNTIAIYDYGRTPDGVFYYAMEFLDGLDLEELVDRDGPQPPGCVAHLLEQIAGALAEAHAAGLIHRDVKPANVLLCERGGMPGVAKVVDFGLVKDVRAEAPALSAVDTVMGTPLYLAPEAIARPGAVDARSDLYSLGALGYFLLTGEHVFEGATVVQVCAHHLHTAPVPPSLRLGQPVPAELEALLLGCLAKDPSQRPQTAFEVCSTLRTLVCREEWTAESAAAWWQRVRAAAASLRPKAHE